MENIYDELSRKAANMASNGHSVTSATASATVPRRSKQVFTGVPGATGVVGSTSCSNGEYSMEKVKMSYDKLDFSQPASNLKPHYHSTSTLKSKSSKEMLSLSTAQNDSGEVGLGLPEPVLESSHHMNLSNLIPLRSTNTTAPGYSTFYTDPRTRRASSNRLSHGDIHQVIKYILYL